MGEAGEVGRVEEGETLVLRTDGASRGNPGPAAAGIVIERRDGTPVAHGKRYLGEMPNNQAEYRALLLGLQAVRRYVPSAVEVRMDSELVVRQMQGRYKVQDPVLQALHAQAQTLVLVLPHVIFTHVPRADNAEADRLANAALDEHARRTRHGA